MSEPVTATLIKKLRDLTGIAMGKCKEALEASKGDIELAISSLRKAGIASAVKKEGRSTNEGKIATAECNGVVSLVELNAETDFVVKNDKFSQFLDVLAKDAAKTKPASLSAFLSQKYSQDQELTVDQYRATLVQTIGENIQIRRVEAIQKTPNVSLGVYSHLGGKIVTLVEISGSANEEGLAKEIAMHVAAAAPEFLSPETVPADVLANEKDIAKGQVKGKPAHIMDKIVEGKIGAFFDANCLTKQKFIKNDSLSIEELLNQKAKETGKPLVLTRFIRWVVGQ